MIAPVVETGRLLLRPLRAGDLDDHAAAMADPEMVRFLGGSPLSREDVWRRVLAAHGLWALFGFGYWAIERKADGAYLGQLGFGDFKREMTPNIEGLPEIGWLLVRHAHGQGYASEAAAGALAWADRILDAPQTVAIIDAANIPSIRIAEKNDFSTREDALYKSEPILLFRRFRR